jgi:hypothetical protein
MKRNNTELNSVHEKYFLVTSNRISIDRLLRRTLVRFVRYAAERQDNSTNNY